MWKAAVSLLVISLGLAGTAYSYAPPGFAAQKLAQAVARQTSWSISGDGMFEGQPLRIDLGSGVAEGVLVRVVHPQASFINSQWIKISDAPDTFRDLAGAVHLTRRLTGEVREGVRLSRYAFLGSGGLKGEILLHPRTYLPYAANIVRKGGGAADTEITMKMTYGTLRSAEVKAQEARTISEVLMQISEIQEKRNGQPKKLTPLSAVSDGNQETAFASDFDHDGLTDALELFYGTDPGNPDTDSDTFLDGDEVERGYNPAGAGTL